MGNLPFTNHGRLGIHGIENRDNIFVESRTAESIMGFARAAVHLLMTDALRLSNTLPLQGYTSLSDPAGLRHFYKMVLGDLRTMNRFRKEDIEVAWSSHCGQRQKKN